MHINIRKWRWLFYFLFCFVLFQWTISSCYFGFLTSGQSTFQRFKNRSQLIYCRSVCWPLTTALTRDFIASVERIIHLIVSRQWQRVGVYWIAERLLKPINVSDGLWIMFLCVYSWRWTFELNWIERNYRWCQLCDIVRCSFVVRWTITWNYPINFEILPSFFDYSLQFSTDCIVSRRSLSFWMKLVALWLFVD